MGSVDNETKLVRFATKFYLHPIFKNYAASKKGEVINVKRRRFLKTKGDIPKGFQIDHINAIKTDNRLKNLEIITHKENVQLARNKPVISINLATEEETLYLSLKSASLDLEIEVSNISAVC